MNLSTELRKFGISETVTRSFGVNTAPELLNYLDLIGKVDGNQTRLPLDGAVEHDQRAVLYYVSEDKLAVSPNDRTNQLAMLNRSIGSRGERAHLAIVKPGKLEISPVRLGEISPNWTEFNAENQDAINFYSNLVHGKIHGLDGEDSDLVFDEMYKLLLTGADAIAHVIGRDNVLSLVGRALFFRFLYDRNIITEEHRSDICSTANELRGCFDNSENAYRTSKWLDQTFNGHFLPFRKRGTRQFFNDLNRSKIVFPNLKAIVRGLEPLGNNQYQHRFDWAVFDFAHVPVGLLSQVYEAFSWKWDKNNSEETSVHYTPRNIAVTLVEEAFAAMTTPHQARVLDPACGAGVFLVLAFRRLYTEHWKVTRKRPDTKAIRQILETQLCGFDISESALRLTALSLYLTAIELDPNPIPPEKLKFKDLNELVLFNHRTDSDPEAGAVVGSIRPDIGTKFDSQFDLILCNPPWSQITDNVEVVEGLNSASRDIVSRRNEELGKDYQNPRGEPDLPFLWKATEWCRPKGQIAMVLPARILFRQGDIATRARTSLFRLIQFTGIVNCSNVRKTKVWPDMDQPFMLAFANNVVPEDDSQFWFVSPQADFSQNQLGELRIDAHSAHVLANANVLQDSWLLKSLAIGTWLDVEVVRKLHSRDMAPLKKYWEEDLKLQSNKGYSVDGKAQKKDSSLMLGMPDVGQANKTPLRFTVDLARCTPFDKPQLCRSVLDYDGDDPLRPYRGPILLVRQSLPRNRKNGVSLSCYADVVFSQSFYGYSGHTHSNPKLVVKYLHLFAHSQIWSYYVLCTSAKLGVERPLFLKSDFDAAPIVPLDHLPLNLQAKIEPMAELLDAGSDAVFENIDAFFADVFGLSEHDSQTIDDTLTVRNPHDELGVRGSTPPTEVESKQFCSEVKRLIRPFAKRVGLQLHVSELQDRSTNDAFQFLRVSTVAKGVVSNKQLQHLILRLADQTGASLIIQKDEDGLLIGILNQYRYWTKSRARLLAADILRDHFVDFERQLRS